MSGYGAYFLKRLAQFALVVFIGINLTFFITHLTPIDPVEQTISALTAFSGTSPEAIEMMRQSLQELYGLKGSLFEQYITFWRRILVADFGPSLSAFPTPVSSLIARALPWTLGPASSSRRWSPGRSAICSEASPATTATTAR